MSREAIGGNGAILGSGEYWSGVNRGTWFGSLMLRPSETTYWETLKEIGDRAAGAVDEIYEDLRKNEKRIHKIESERRNTLAKQVRALYDVSRMAGTSCPHCGECESILSLSGYLVWSKPFGNACAMQAAVWRVRNDSEFSAGECIDLIKRAVEWGIGYAAGGSKKKRAFLEEISKEKGKDFFEEVLEAYESSSETEIRGGCGHAIGAGEYLSYMERTVFLQELPAAHSARWGRADYAGRLKESVEGIARQLERDLERGGRENSYITDETEQALKLAAVELERCGAMIGSLGGKIERLAWFVGGDPSKIRQLQQKLNQLGVGEHLTEDGVYGKKTNASVGKFMDALRGSVPMLAWIDPLQSARTKIYSMPIKSNGVGYSSLRDLSPRSINPKGTTVFRADAPHSGADFYHINTVEGKSIKSGKYSASELQLNHLNGMNHSEISDDAYKVLQNFDGVAKKIRAAGRVLAVTGVVLDALELYQTIEIDKHDADRKIGKTTYSEIASIGGSWAGGALGAKGGALLGASIGTAIFPGVGTAIGGAAGGLILGIVGSFTGDKLGSYVVDITMVE